MKRLSRKLKNWRRWRKRDWAMAACAAFFVYCAGSFLLLPDPSEFSTRNPAEWSMLAKRRAEAQGEDREFKLLHNWVPIQRISKNIARAVIASEDTSFFDHTGVDTAELYKVLGESFSNFRFPRGASTITQQLAKNLYLADSWSVIRKPKELIIAKRIEGSLRKARILEIYLNIVEWGEGIFGAEAAAQFYFGKPSAYVSADEAAFLAAILPNPRTKFNPRVNPRGVKARQDIIRARMKTFRMPGD